MASFVADALMMTVVFLTALTLVAFAANSVLCRLALEGGSIDPYSFTTIRLVAGVMVLIPVSRLTMRGKKAGQTGGSLRSGAALYAYAAAFSLAYISLSAGTGALILFGSVQFTMLIVAFRAGERMRASQWAGFALAIVGLVYLVLPGISAPDPFGAGLMMLSGIAWGLYSVAGRGASNPIAMTCGNFVWAAPMALVVSVLALSQAHLDSSGVALAIVSGAVTSGLGYVIWYRALPMLSTTQASIVQLLVPLLAALGGAVFIAEPFSLRLALSTAMILGGVAFAILAKQRPRRSGAAVDGTD